MADGAGVVRGAAGSRAGSSDGHVAVRIPRPSDAVPALAGCRRDGPEG